MAKGLRIREPFTLVNAPAGSGKTTAVSNSIKTLLQTPIKRILCITYTNRAAEQLAIKINSERVDISTIHSFIANLMKPFFKLKIIIDYFGEFYTKKIEAILNSENEKDKEKIERYKIRYNLDKELKVTKDVVIENISYLDYGETPFSSFLYGKLSHDDLLIFSKEVFGKFPKLNKVISQRYSYVFIDEYQDTQAEILELFYNATLESKTKLVLLGDEMQQIYQERVERFQKTINESFVKDQSLKNNWRSQKKIVDILNNLYFDPLYRQDAKKEEGIKPSIYIVKDANKTPVESNSLQLVLYNSHLFKEIGSYTLYDAYNQRYKRYDKNNTKDILSNITMDNPDDLMLLLLFITEICELFEECQFSKLIQRITNFKFANKEIWRIKRHSDKVMIHKYLKDLSNKVKENLTIEELLVFLRENKIIETSYIDEVIENIERDIVFRQKINLVGLEEFFNCYNEMKKPTFSTQHAVKGEGYENVTLKVSDGTNPNVKMHLFLEILSKELFNYQELKEINLELKEHLYSFSYSFGMNPLELRRATFTEYKKQCQEHIINLKTILMKNKKLYTEFFMETFETFDKKISVTTFKACIKSIKCIEGILLAYKLFYVGCSRAQEKLDVYVSADSIKKFEREFTVKMEQIGFEVIKSEI